MRRIWKIETVSTRRHNGVNSMSGKVDLQTKCNLARLLRHSTYNRQLIGCLQRQDAMKQIHLRGNSACLITRDGIDIGESPSGGESNAVGLTHWVNNGTFRLKDCPARINLGRANVGEIGATIALISFLKLAIIKAKMTNLLGHAGLKIVASGPKQPFLLSSPGGPATPSSPEA